MLEGSWHFAYRLLKPTNLRGGSAEQEESEEESEGFPGFCPAEFGIDRLGSQKHR